MLIHHDIMKFRSRSCIRGALVLGRQDRIIVSEVEHLLHKGFRGVHCDINNLAVLHDGRQHRIHKALVGSLIQCSIALEHLGSDLCAIVFDQVLDGLEVAFGFDPL